MKEDLKIAWRNLWRNRRRTIITSESVFFAVFFAIIMRSVQLGSYDRMIMNFIGSYSGYLQVQNSKYTDNPSIDNSFVCPDSTDLSIRKIENVVSLAPHIESFILASGGTRTKGVMVLAVDPAREKSFSNPENRLVKFVVSQDAIERLRALPDMPQKISDRLEDLKGSSYSSRAGFELELGLKKDEKEKYLAEIYASCFVINSYLEAHDDGILVSSRLADYLKVARNDTLILIGQGFHGASAAGVFPVRGIIRLPTADIDSRLVIMTIHKAQDFFDISGRITSLAINLTGKSDRVTGRAAAAVSKILPDSTMVVRTWKDLNPVLVQQIQGDSETGLATLFLLYFIIFFGIFGTVLMMMAERTREFGVLISIGMQRKRLKRIIMMEILLLGTIGLVSGMIVSAPVISYFYFHPLVLRGQLGKIMEDYGWDTVMPTAWFGVYFYWQAVVVFAMVLAAMVYPLRKISKLREIEALRS